MQLKFFMISSNYSGFLDKLFSFTCIFKRFFIYKKYIAIDNSSNCLKKDQKLKLRSFLQKIFVMIGTNLIYWNICSGLVKQGSKFHVTMIFCRAQIRKKLKIRKIMAKSVSFYMFLISRPYGCPHFNLPTPIDN